MGHSSKRSSGLLYNRSIAIPHQSRKQRRLQRNPFDRHRIIAQLLPRIDIMHPTQTYSKPASTRAAVVSGQMGSSDECNRPGISAHCMALCILPTRHAGHFGDNELGCCCLWWSGYSCIDIFRDVCSTDLRCTGISSI